MEYLYIPFGEYLPDMPALNNPGVTLALEVFAGPNTYRPLPPFGTITNSLGINYQGGGYATDQNGIEYNFAGDYSGMSLLSGSAWSYVYSGGTNDFSSYWEVVQWGNTLLGVHGKDTSPFIYSLGAASATAMSGSPPRAYHIDVVRDFVVMGNCSDSALSKTRVRWCAINNPASWTQDTATLADFQDLPTDGGVIQKIVGGEYGIIFQEKAIYRMTFVGSPLVFQFDRIHDQIGAYAPASVVNYENLIFFLSTDGFYMFDGINLKPIGKGKIDKTFLYDLDTTSYNGSAYLYQFIKGEIDPDNKQVLWSYPTTAGGGAIDKIIVYNWAYDRWTLLSRSPSRVAKMINNKRYLIGFYTGVGNYTKFSRFGGGGNLAIPFIQTGEFKLNQKTDGKATIFEVRPVINITNPFSIATPKIALVTRDTLDTTPVTGTAIAVNSQGFVSFRTTARYVKFILQGPVTLSAGDATLAGFDGLEIAYEASGKR